MFNHEKFMDAWRASGLTMYQLARACGLSNSYLYLLGQGRYKSPKPSTIQKIASILGLDWRVFYDG